ncbi:MAG: nicotinamide-nucleotide amidohydrolase family protein [Candidatus Dormibacteraeota bacterium]|nr:nicotinamide-nucleotide amidohydrolase family protein [Candidatus Dormibacteraeota bacterium]
MSAPFGIRGHQICGLPVQELLIRFAFGAAISLVAGIVSLLTGDKVGGMLLAFPAILPAALTLVERNSGTSAAVSDVRGAAVGAIALALFAVTVKLLATTIPVIAALAAAAAVWALAAGGIYLAGRLAARLLVETQYLPDVPANEVEPLVAALRRAGLTVATAESCTGGALTALLTAVPDASRTVVGGITAYTDETKEAMLDVSPAIIATEGAISEACARAMAEGVRRRLQTDVGLGVTGVLGAAVDGVRPGTMFVAAVGPAGSRCERLFNGGGPEAARSDAIRKAVELGLQVSGARSR